MPTKDSTKALMLIRNLMRRAREIPSYNHQRVALHRIRSEVAKGRNYDETKAKELMTEGEIYLDTLTHQRDHLRTMQSQETLVESVDMQAIIKERRRINALKRQQKAAAAKAEAEAVAKTTMTETLPMTEPADPIQPSSSTAGHHHHHGDGCGCGPSHDSPVKQNIER